jgi:polyprenyl-phospho-N-acetylgalactosaminyl synthase
VTPFAQRPSEVFVVVAAYNEAAHVGRVAAELMRDGWTVVVVDDGSRDGTAAAARGGGARVLRHPFNLGPGAALQTGIDHAVAAGAAAIVTFDADGQHCAADVHGLLAALDGGADIAVGSRFLGRIDGASTARRTFLRAAVTVSNKLSGVRFSDSHCGIRAFRAAVAPALRLRQAGMAHASELLAHIRRHGLRAVEVPVTVRYTEYSRSKGQSSLQAIRILFDVVVRRP